MLNDSEYQLKPTNDQSSKIQTSNSLPKNERKSDEFLFDTLDDIEIEVEEELTPIKINSISLHNFDKNNTFDKEINSLVTVPLNFREATTPDNVPI